MAAVSEATRVSRTRILVLVVAIAALAILGYHLYALRLAENARDQTRPLPERAASAMRAARLEPWNKHVTATAAIVEAQVLVRAGRIDDAYFLLLPLSTDVRDDALFRETYQTITAAKSAVDARKAHQQHGKEGPLGELDPDDVER